MSPRQALSSCTSLFSSAQLHGLYILRIIPLFSYIFSHDATSCDMPGALFDYADHCPKHPFCRKKTLKNICTGTSIPPSTTPADSRNTPDPSSSGICNEQQPDDILVPDAFSISGIFRNTSLPKIFLQHDFPIFFPDVFLMSMKYFSFIHIYFRKTAY